MPYQTNTLSLADNWMPNTSPAFQKLRDKIPKATLSSAMFFCVILFILFKRSFRDIADVALILLVIGTIVHCYKNPLVVKSDPYPRLFLISLTVPIFSWIHSLILPYDEPTQIFPGHIDLFYLFIFWFLAYWIKGDEQRIKIALYTFCFAILLMFWLATDHPFSEITLGVQGQRVSFGQRNAQHASLFSCFSLITSAFLLAHELWSRSKPRLFPMAICAFLTILFSLFVIITQSRQVWLALILIVTVAPLLYALSNPGATRRKAVAISYVFIFSLLSGISTLDIIESRIGKEWSVISNVTQLQLEDVPETSVGLRLIFAAEGFKWFQMRPVFGYGPGLDAEVIQSSEHLSKKARNEFTHLHNSHISTLISYGLAGSTLVYFVMLYPFFSMVRKRKEGDGLWMIFAGSTMIAWMAINFFESFFFMWDGVYVYTVMMAIQYSFFFKNNSQTSEKTSIE